MFGLDLGFFTINSVYWACLGVGGMLLILTFIFDELFSAIHLDVGGPMTGPVIAAFLASFGGAGLITHEIMGMKPVNSGLASLAFSGLLSVSVYYGFIKVVLAQQGGTETDPASLIGKVAEVIITIPEKASGEITFETNAGRMSGAARSKDGAPIPRNTLVVIERVISGSYIVRPMTTAEEGAGGSSAAQN
ncbi:hypothetical protein HZA57_07185 [Candidatus Poribacteria bacterium]|nr:hypothetical protein [Candidatus Poribacteria bacterium]